MTMILPLTSSLKVLQLPTFRNLDWLPSELRRQFNFVFLSLWVSLCLQLLIQISLSVTINQASILLKLSGMLQVGELWGATFQTPKVEKRYRNKSYLKFLYLTQAQFPEYTAAISLLPVPHHGCFLCIQPPQRQTAHSHQHQKLPQNLFYLPFEGITTTITTTFVKLGI